LGAARAAVTRPLRHGCRGAGGESPDRVELWGAQEATR
jgi:hypothetical protein